MRIDLPQGPIEKTVDWHVCPYDRHSRMHVQLARGWAFLYRSRYLRRILRPGWLRRICMHLPGARDAMAMAVFQDDSKFVFPCHDRYWGSYLLCNRIYEEEVLRLLWKLRDVPYDFVDLGANFGYWSVLASGRMLGAHRVVAVEPAPDTFAMLSLNARLNNDRFTCIQAAVVPERCSKVRFAMDPGHYGRHVEGVKVHLGRRSDLAEVPGILLDDVLYELFDNERVVIVKMDIEGAEVDVLRNSKIFDRADIMMIFEDHGGSAEWKAVKLVIEKGWTVYRLDVNGLHIIQDVGALPKDGREEDGYNFAGLAPENELRAIIETDLKGSG